MRKITQESVEAFTNWDDLKKQNTEVKSYIDGIAKMWLHWNLIAELNHYTRELYISDAGWQTITTKERLNWILEHFSLGKLKTIKWDCFLINWKNKEKFEGEKIFKIK